MKERGLVIWFILMMLLFGVVFNLNSNITGMVVENPIEISFDIPQEPIVNQNFDVFVDVRTNGNYIAGGSLGIFYESGAIQFNSCSAINIDSNFMNCEEINPGEIKLDFLSGNPPSMPPLPDGNLIVLNFEAQLAGGVSFEFIPLPPNDLILFDENMQPISTGLININSLMVNIVADCSACDDNNPCTEDICDSNTGECTNQFLNDGEACNNGICENGVCVSLDGDECPNDPDKTEAGVCGCGAIDEDLNSDGVMDCIEETGFIGKVVDLDKTNPNSNILSVYVDGSAVSDDGYSENKEVRIDRVGQTITEFDYNFGQNDLSLDGVYIFQKTSGSYGFTITKGLSNVDKKTIYVKKIKQMNYVCVKDTADVDSVSDIRIDCSGDDEIIVECDNNDHNGYKCESLADYYKVSGLTHSAVVEIRCNESWKCTSWGACINKKQNRTCTDLKKCNTTLFRPDLVQSCVSNETSGAPEDDFTDYGEPEIQQQTPSITVPKVEKPKVFEEKKVEQPSGGFSFKWFLLGIVLIVWIGIMVWLFAFRKKKKHVKEEMFKEEEKKPTTETPKVEKKVEKSKVEKETDVPSAPVAPKNEKTVETPKVEKKKNVDEELPW